MSVEAILRDIEALSSAELKARLAERFRDAPPALPPEVVAELERRVEAADANPGVGYAWEEVVAYVKRTN